MKIFKMLLAGFLLATLTVGCNSEKKTEATDETSTTEETIIEKVEKELNYPIPTSFEVVNLLQEAGAGYVIGVTNDTKNVDSYISEYSKALNLGVYGADLSYATTYNRKQETTQFMNASRSLIDQLNISSVFNQEMANRVESNLDNKDSLITIVTESFYNTYKTLNDNGQDKLSLLVITGSVVEGLYITTQLIVSSGYDTKLIQAFTEQKGTVKQLETLLEQYNDDANIAKVLPKIRYISLFYDSVGDAEMTQGQINDVSASIEDTRNEIIKG